MKISKTRLLEIIKEEIRADSLVEQEIIILEEKKQEIQNRIDQLRMNIASDEKTQHDTDRRGTNE